MIIYRRRDNNEPVLIVASIHGLVAFRQWHRSAYGQIMWGLTTDLDFSKCAPYDTNNCPLFIPLENGPVYLEPLELLTKAQVEQIHPWKLPHPLMPGDKVKHLDGSNGEVAPNPSAKPNYVKVIWQLPYPLSSQEFFWAETEVPLDTLTRVD